MPISGPIFLRLRPAPFLKAEHPQADEKIPLDKKRAFILQGLLYKSLKQP
jgi:hypothetical protein